MGRRQKRKIQELEAHVLGLRQRAEMYQQQRDRAQDQLRQIRNIVGPTISVRGYGGGGAGGTRLAEEVTYGSDGRRVVW